MWLARVKPVCLNIFGTTPSDDAPASGVARNVVSDKFLPSVCPTLGFRFSQSTPLWFCPSMESLTCACSTMVRDVIPRFWEGNNEISGTILFINGFRWFWVQNEAEWVRSSLDLWGSGFDIKKLYFSYIISFSLRFLKVFPCSRYKGKSPKTLGKTR